MIDQKNTNDLIEFTSTDLGDFGQGSVIELSDYLFNDRESPEIFRKSKDNLDKVINLYNRTNMVSFVGAGTSKPLGISKSNVLLFK